MKFKKFSPFTGEVLREYDYAAETDIFGSIEALHNTFGVWKKLSPDQRQEKLKPVVGRLAKRKGEFAKAMTTEMGKRPAESLAEVEKCITSIDSLLAMDLSFLQNSTTRSIYKESEVSNQPLGVIYSIMPWNFPLWQAVRMILPGLLAGNTILLKHSEVTPEMGRLIDELFAELFPGPLLIHRLATHEMTEPILADWRVRGVSITGSTKAGLQVSRLATKYLKKFVLELGGSDPYVVFADADLAQTAKWIAQSRLQNSGQSCIAAKRCLVQENVKTIFLEMLKGEFERFETGPLADVRFKDSLAAQLAQLKEKTGAQLYFGRPSSQPEAAASVDAQIYVLPKNSSWLKDQEFFAPVLLVIPFTTADEAVQIANSTDYGLGGAVFSQNISFAKTIATQIQAGQVAINEFIKSDVSLPFGGVKMSGVGRELGHHGFLEFTAVKVISHS